MSAPRRLDQRCGECLLYAAIQGMADGLILTDDEGRVFHLNRRGQEILGLDPRQVVGSPITLHMRIPQMTTLWTAAARERSAVMGEITFPSGATIQATVSSCLSATGQRIGRMILLRDATREKRIQIELATTVAERLIEMTDSVPRQEEALPLTAREREILELLVEGLTNAQMAERLHVSLNTIASHLKNVYAKLDVSGRAQAAALAVSRGIGTPSRPPRIR